MIFIIIFIIILLVALVLIIVKNKITHRIGVIDDISQSSESGKNIIIPKGTKIFFGKPAKYPESLINALKLFCENQPRIRRAYVVQLYEESSGQSSHLLIEFDLENECPEIFIEAGNAIRPYIPKGDVVDFMKIRAKDKISDYCIQHITPIYEKRS